MNRFTTSASAADPMSFAWPDPPTGVVNPNSSDSIAPDRERPVCELDDSATAGRSRLLTLLGGDAVLVNGARSTHALRRALPLACSLPRSQHSVDLPSRTSQGRVR